jgi:hypothetical protein
MSATSNEIKQVGTVEVGELRAHAQRHTHVMRRLVGPALAVIAFVGCSGSSVEVSPAGSTSTVAVSSVATGLVDLGGLTVAIPSAWAYRADGWRSSFETLLGYWSSVPLGDSCSSTDGRAGGVQTTCGPPLTSLPGGAVLVSWSVIGRPLLPGQTEIEQPNTTIGGQAARLTVESPGVCGLSIDATVSITADIARPGGNHFEMRACLRDPTDDVQAALMTMLGTAKIAP